MTKAKMKAIAALVAATIDKQQELIDSLSLRPSHERSMQTKELIDVARGRIYALEDVMQALHGDLGYLKMSAN